MVTATCNLIVLFIMKDLGGQLPNSLGNKRRDSILRAVILKPVYRTRNDIECSNFLLIAKNKGADSLQIVGDQ